MPCMVYVLIGLNLSFDPSIVCNDCSLTFTLLEHQNQQSHFYSSIKDSICVKIYVHINTPFLQIWSTVLFFIVFVLLFLTLQESEHVFLVDVFLFTNVLPHLWYSQITLTSAGVVSISILNNELWFSVALTGYTVWWRPFRASPVLRAL